MKQVLTLIILLNFSTAFTQNVSIQDFENEELTSELIDYTNNTFELNLTINSTNELNDDTFSSMVLKDRLAVLDAKTPFDVPYNATVERFIRLYIKDKKEAISNLMDRAEYYFPIFEERLDKYDIPLEMKYLAVVESALLPTATSHAGAKGIWQFMYHTGKEYGLEVTSYIDDRNDPLKATEAACQFLKHLYDTFGDWDLALAAYNSGAGNVNKAIRRAGGKRNYWNLRQYLPQETSSYVPAFYAMFYLFEYGDTHQIYANKVELNYFDTDTIHINKEMSFSQIEKRSGVSKEILTTLNPQYKLGIIPYQKGKQYVLTLPNNAIDSFLNSVETDTIISHKELPLYIEPTSANSYVVQNLDNLPKIAKKHGITLEQLKKWNGLQTDFLIEGQRLVITEKASEVAMDVSIQTVRESKTATPQLFKSYIVKQGDSLFLISKKFPNVSIDQIRNWNNVWGVNYIKPGTELKILTNPE